MNPSTIRIGISSCLLGNEVRYDGGHKRDRFLTDVLGPFVEWVPVCPEVEVGMGIPRESIRLVRRDGEVRLVAERSGLDHTDLMRAWATKRLAGLERLGLCGFVLKKDSPSCGLERVRVHGGHSPVPARNGRGVFAEELLAHFTTLPVEEEGRLNDPVLRENFIESVFAFHRLRTLFAGRWTNGQVVAFHARHKLQLLAHVPSAYQRLGRLVAEVKRLPRAELRERYETDFMNALRKPATIGRHVNVLQHAVGYFRDQLDASRRAAVREVVDDYGKGLVPLVVPVTLVRHYVKQLGIGYLDGQTYLDPHPKELMLRNHV